VRARGGWGVWRDQRSEAALLRDGCTYVRRGMRVVYDTMQCVSSAICKLSRICACAPGAKRSLIDPRLSVRARTRAHTYRETESRRVSEWGGDAHTPTHAHTHTRTHMKARIAVGANRRLLVMKIRRAK
jgi:hypothetical protein